MKRLELIITTLLVPLDAAMLFLAAVFAYQLRFYDFITQYRPVIFTITFDRYLQLAVPFVFLWLGIFALTGLYEVRGTRKILREIKMVFVACTLGLALFTVLIFLRGELFSSRFIVLVAYILAILLVSGARLAMRLVKRVAYAYGLGTKRVVFVGTDKTSSDLKAFIRASQYYGMDIIAEYGAADSMVEEIRGGISSLRPDLIILGEVKALPSLSEQLLDLARENHLEFHYAADLFETKSSNTDIGTIGDIPVIEIKQTALDGWGRIYKRIFDLVAGAILCLLLLPFMAIIAVAIRTDSRGPIIYKNRRAGKAGNLFFAYKFRRMKVEYCTGEGYDNKGKAAQMETELIKKQSHRAGPLYKIVDDPRNTKVGKFLERTSLDELPQLFNVIAGSMSLVGPRPHQPREIEKYKKHHKRVMAIKPGITGLAQISGRSDLDFEEEVRLDTFYLENWSLRADMAILLKTPFALLRRHKS